MPDGHGLELLRALRQQPETQTTPVLIVCRRHRRSFSQGPAIWRTGLLAQTAGRAQNLGLGGSILAHRQDLTRYASERAKQAPHDRQSTKKTGAQGACLIFRWVADGTRTHDNQNHNLGLYQLSYSHHRKDIKYILFFRCCDSLCHFFCLHSDTELCILQQRSA